MRLSHLFEQDEITLQNISGALDKDKKIMLGDEKIGEVSRGWLRLGGEQWVAQLTGKYAASAFGDKTLKDLKRTIAWKVRNTK